MLALNFAIKHELNFEIKQRLVLLLDEEIKKYNEKYNQN